MVPTSSLRQIYSYLPASSLTPNKADIVCILVDAGIQMVSPSLLLTSSVDSLVVEVALITFLVLPSPDLPFLLFFWLPITAFDADRVNVHFQPSTDELYKKIRLDILHTAIYHSDKLSHNGSPWAEDCS